MGKIRPNSKRPIILINAAQRGNAKTSGKANKYPKDASSRKTIRTGQSIPFICTEYGRKFANFAKLRDESSLTIRPGPLKIRRPATIKTSPGTKDLPHP